jgi:hypothetical protein
MACVSLLLYIGPETMMPVASAAATIVGCLLIGWRFVFAAAVKCFRLVLGARVSADADNHSGSQPAVFTARFGEAAGSNGAAQERAQPELRRAA